MKEIFNNILKQTFYNQLIQYRSVRELTQVQMAARLIMAPRSYIELDHGHATCTSLTLARFLIYCCDDSLAFLKELQRQFEVAEKDAV